MLALSVLTVLASVATLVLALSISEDGHYDTRYNHLDIERILNNKRLVTYYAQCLTGDGPCTPQGTEFKRILPEALRTNCARCTEKQKTTAYHAIRRLKKEYPKIWQELQASWDPTGEYVSTFINTVESANANNNNNKPVTPGAERPADNEITKEAPRVPLPRGIPKLEASTPAVAATRVEATQTQSTTTTTESYRTSFRPTSDLLNNQATQTTTKQPATISTTIQKIPPRTSPSTQSYVSTTITDTAVQPSSLLIDLLNNNQETKTTTTTSTTSRTQNIVPLILSRGGPDDATTDSNYRTSNRPTSDTNSQGTQTTATVRPTTQNIPRVIPFSARPIIPTQDTDTNYRISYRPTRFNILLPRPQDIGRLTANVIGSIGDIGTKVIRTGARIADMVLTGVQAGVQATIGRGRIQQ